MNEPSAPRCAALVGPYLSGKTTLLESLLAATGAITRKGTIKEGNTVGDSSPESRARQMSTELSVAGTDYLGDPWTFIDCPGSIELIQEAYNALLVSDAAVIVCEPVADKALTLAPLMRFLAANTIPYIIFINKMDTASTGVGKSSRPCRGFQSAPWCCARFPSAMATKSPVTWTWSASAPSAGRRANSRN